MGSRDAQTKLPLCDEVISELREIPGDEEYLQQHQKSFGTRSLRVLTAVRCCGDDEKMTAAAFVQQLKREVPVVEARRVWPLWQPMARGFSRITAKRLRRAEIL
ncbi:MAG: hypothetical protein JOZ03_07365 [Gammaproteobacteria bacterium]|nr:hypothetical protein [Gammaproteobacteria bacterium]